MHPSLWLLAKLQLNGTVRRFRRSLKTVRGALLTIFALIMLSMMILPSLLAGDQFIGQWGLVSTYGPFMLFAYTLFLMFSSIGEQAIHFTPSEVDFLFPAPFTRRQLLSYRLATNLLTVLGMSFFVGLMGRVYVSNVFAGFVGGFLTLMFMNLLATFTGLVGQTVSTRAFTRSRQAIGIVLIAILAYAVSSALMSWEGTSIHEIPKLVESTVAGRVVLAPFRVLCNVVTAKQLLPDVLVPAGIAVLMNVGLVIGIMWLDADFNDTAIRVARTKLERLKKMQQGDFSGTSSSKSRSSTRISMFPYWLGAGPLIWRQVVRAFRQAKVMLRVGAVFLVFACIPIYRNFMGKEPDPNMPLYALGWLAYFTVLFAGAAPIGFRVDIDRMEVLKSLPTSSTGVVLGQVFGAALIISFVHWIAMLILAVVFPSGWYYWFAGVVLCLPVNCLLMTVSNGLFLLMPVRMQAGSQDPQAAFKNMFIMMLQFLIYAVVAAITCAPAGVAYYATNNITVSIVAGLITLLGVTAVGLLFVRFAFDRFDVTRHAPTS